MNVSIADFITLGGMMQFTNSTNHIRIDHLYEGKFCNALTVATSITKPLRNHAVAWCF